MADLAYKIMNQRTFPGYGWWIEQGATVTWENWNGNDSHNHPMFGGGLVWFYRDLAGLRPAEAGFRNFEVRPSVPEGLEWVEYTHMTTYGPIAIRWQNRKGRFTLECDVPVGTTATVWLPFSGAEPKVKEGDGVRRAGVRDGRVLYELASGHYTLKSRI